MKSARRLRLPVGPDAEKWLTLPADRTVLAVVHNVTALSRLIDILAVLEGDRRVQVVFTVTGSSPFAHGIDEQLAALGAITIPWRQALDGQFDLAVTASHGGDLHRIRAPLIIAPHGIGYNKYLDAPDSRGVRRRAVFGLSPEWLLRNGRPIASALVLSHHEQLDRLRVYCPPAVATAAVVGDPCLDRLVASRHLRAAHRTGFGLCPGQRLVVLSSTWGVESLLGRNAELPSLLLAQLPVDRYRVAIVLHPNVWHGHSPWQTRAWLAECERAGAILVPPWESWRAALTAADVVIGDHGSVTMYAAAAGRPVLIAVEPPDNVDPDSPIAQFTRAAPRLVVDEALADQIERVVAQPQVSRYSRFVDLATSEPGNAAANLRALIYRYLRLPEPARPAFTPIVPVPAPGELRPAPTTAHLVRTARAGGTLRIDRYPAELRLCQPPAGDTHLAVDLRHHDPSLLQVADVIVARTADTGDDPVGFADRALASFAGAAVVACALVDGGCLIAVRGGGRFRLSTMEKVFDEAILASVGHALAAEGRRTCTVTVEVSGRPGIVLVKPA